MSVFYGPVQDLSGDSFVVKNAVYETHGRVEKNVEKTSKKVLTI